MLDDGAGAEAGHEVPGFAAVPPDPVAHLIVRIGHALGQRWGRDLGQFGLTGRQHGVLAVLAAHPGVSAGALAREAMIIRQSMSELLSALEARGSLLRQAPAGRGHSTQLTLTDEARALLADLEPVVTSSNSSRTPGLDGLELV